MKPEHKPLEGDRLKRLTVKVIRLLYAPKPGYELFVDRDGRSPWFAMILFPTYREWDAYALLAVLKRFFRDLAATAQQLGDSRFKTLCDRIVTMIEIAAQTEPLEGEVSDGKLQ